MFTVYVIKSLSASRYYIGVTTDLKERLKQHNSGSNQSTKNRGPWQVVYMEEFMDKKQAWLRERQIKKYKGGEAFKRLLSKFR